MAMLPCEYRAKILGRVVLAAFIRIILIYFDFFDIWAGTSVRGRDDITGPMCRRTLPGPGVFFTAGRLAQKVGSDPPARVTAPSQAPRKHGPVCLARNCWPKKDRLGVLERPKCPLADATECAGLCPRWQFTDRRQCPVGSQQQTKNGKDCRLLNIDDTNNNRYAF